MYLLGKPMSSFPIHSTNKSFPPKLEIYINIRDWWEAVVARDQSDQGLKASSFVESVAQLYSKEDAEQWRHVTTASDTTTELKKSIFIRAFKTS